MEMPGPIPNDDIDDMYIAVPRERKIAVSNIIRSHGYMVSTLVPNDETDSTEIMVDWKADQALAIAMVLGMIEIGQRQFGDVWLQSLKNNLSHTA